MTFLPRQRLGNNLFQWAAAFALAKRTGDRLCVPPWRYAADFGIQIDRPQAAEDFRERSFSYSEIKHDPKDSIRLCGYFQSEKYFDDYLDEIRMILCPSSIERRDVCAVHVRRTDYVGNANYADIFKAGYYEKAMSGSEILFFSDDIEWCKQVFGNCEFSEEKDPVKDLRKMAGCSRIIGSNSTFALWAAIISGHSNCIFPRAWFAGPSLRLDTKDLIPERFTVIDL